MSNLSKKQIQEQLRLLNTIIGHKRAVAKIKMPDGKKLRSSENIYELADLAKKRSELIEQLNQKEAVHKLMKIRKERDQKTLVVSRRRNRHQRNLENGFRPNRGAHKTERGFMNYKYNFIFGKNLAQLILS